MRRRRRKPDLLDEGLALSLAGQVAVGLMRQAEPREPGEELTWGQEMEASAIRARTALFAIGLMIRNAAPSPDVQAALDAADLYVVRKVPGGVSIGEA